MSTKTPEHIRSIIRSRLGLKNDPDHAQADTEIDAMTPMERLRHVCGWKLGYSNWADTFIDWAKDCGLETCEIEPEYQYQCGFEGQDWSYCAKEHYDMVVANPQDYTKDGYRVRRLLVVND